MTLAVTKRHAVQLGIVAAAGWATARALRGTAPIGREIRDRELVHAILHEPGAPGVGPPDASLRLAIFSDYRCPACRRGFPAVEESVQADGDIRVVYKDWPIFGPASVRAATIALASARRGIYPEVHRRLMTDPRIIDDAMLRDTIRAAGGDWVRTVADAGSDARAIAARLAANGREALAIGLTGTPGYLAGPIAVLGAIDRTQATRLFARARDVAAT